MKNNTPAAFAKHFLVLVTILSFLLNSVPTVLACGPYRTETLFSFDVRPENLETFASGKIGILRPEFARSYLVIAYRVLNDLPLSEEEQKKAVELWNYRLGTIDPETNTEEPDAPEKWSKVRGRFLGEKETKDSLNDNDLWKMDADGFSSYLNCTESAFETAARTLEERLLQYPGQRENIKIWLAGQDAVFSNCSGKGKLPEATGEDAPPWLEKDRDYQLAAALFYQGRLAEAQKRFEKISADDSSRWSKLSSYLIARTYLRMAGSNNKLSAEYTRQAEEHLQNLLKDEGMREIHQISRQLLYVAANRSRTKDHFHGFSKNLSSAKEIEDMRSEVEIYTKYMDSLGIRSENDEKVRETEKAVVKTTAAAVQKSELTFWEWILSWFFTAEKPKQTAKVVKKEVSEVTETKDSNDDIYDYDKPELKNSMRFSSRINFDNITEIALSEDISAWIFAVQSNDKKAFEYALKRWQKTDRIHWLLAAISSAGAEYKDAEKLIEQADLVKPDSPAFATVKYHQFRLLIEKDNFELARKKIDEFLEKDINKLPLSSQNRFFAQRMLVARDLDEFLKFAPRKAIAYSSYSYFQDETSEIGSYGSPDERDKGMLRWRNRWMFDQDSAEIFNQRMPLKMLMKAGLNKNIPDYLRKGILISALTRAILLEDKTAERKTARDLIALAPEMAGELAAFAQKPNHLTTFKLLVKYPVMQPLVDEGFGRFIIPSDSLAYDRDNWWYRDELKIEKKFIDEPIMPKFLSASDLEVAGSERKKLFAKGHTGEIISEKAVLASKNFPNEKKLPELLYKTLQANRYGDNDGDDRRNTKTVFQTLHRRFPKSIWAKRSPVWH